jgi:hypothetical protein
LGANIRLLRRSVLFSSSLCEASGLNAVTKLSSGLFRTAYDETCDV